MFLNVLSKIAWKFCFYENALKLQKWSVFSRKKWSLFINTALLQLEQPLVPISYLTLKCTFIHLFITSFNVGTLIKIIAKKNQPLNIITKKTKTVIIITKMHAYGYNVIFMFGILNNRNQYLWNSLCCV